MGARVRALADGIPGWAEIARRTITLYRALAAREAGLESRAARSAA
jgi:hypothetical protein